LAKKTIAVIALSGGISHRTRKTAKRLVETGPYRWLDEFTIAEVRQQAGLACPIQIIPRLLPPLDHYLPYNYPLPLALLAIYERRRKTSG